MIDSSKTIAGFVILDPLAQVQEYIQNVDIEQLERDVALGMVLMVEYADGTRDFVEPSEVDLSLVGTRVTLNLMEQEVTVPVINSVATVLTSVNSMVNELWRESGKVVPMDDEMMNLQHLVGDMNDRYGDNVQG